jgi:hypothetical protein
VFCGIETLMPGDLVRVVSQSSPHDSSIESIATLLNHGLLSHSAPHSLYIISLCNISLFVFQIIIEIAHKNKKTVTMENRLKVYRYYFDDIYFRKIYSVPVRSVELINNLISEEKRGNFVGNYGISATNALRHG